MKRIVVLLPLFLFGVCDNPQIAGPHNSQSRPVALSVVAQAQASSTYKITISGPDMDTIHLEEEGGQSINIFVPVGPRRLFYLERYDSLGVRTDTGSMLVDIGEVNVIRKDEVTITLRSAIKSFNVIFSFRNGTADSTAVVDSGMVVAKLPDPSRSGYMFGGWYPDSAYGIQWDFARDKMIRDTILYAKWTLDTVGSFIVTFKFQNGSSDTSQIVDSATVVTKPADPTHNGFIFGGWYREEECVNAWSFTADTIVQDTTLYAKWTQNPLGSFTVTFKFQNDSSDTSQTVDSATVAIEPEEPVRSGYSFGGWYREEGCVNAWSFTADTIVQDTTLYAKWTQNPLGSFTVTFKFQNDSSDTSQTVDSATVAIEPEEPVRIGYSFGGWYREEGCVNAWSFSADTIVQDTTLYAKWTQNPLGSFTVTFKFQNDSLDILQTVDSATVATKPADPTRSGFTFGGWYREAGYENEWSFTGDMIVQDTLLYAKWNANSYSVTFDMQLGQDGDLSTLATYGAPMPAGLASPNRVGYDFIGYYSAVTGGNQYYNDSMHSLLNWNIDANDTLFARWIAKAYTISLDIRGGNSETNSVIATFGSAMPTATKPSKTAYRFVGYYDAISGGVQYYDSAMAGRRNWDISDNSTLFAHWDPVQYSITYKLNNGSNHPSNPSSYTIETETIVLQAPTRAGFIFIDWYIDSLFATQSSTIMSGSSVNKVFYARWSIAAETFTDIDGNIYSTITLGDKIWMVENYRATRLANGNSIPHLFTASEWADGLEGGYCYAFNVTDSQDRSKYGALYKLATSKDSNFAPTGWRVSHDTDWVSMQSYLVNIEYNLDGSNPLMSIAKAIASQTDWVAYETPGTVGNDLPTNNAIGFSAYPAGYRDSNGAFNVLGKAETHWWSPSTSNSTIRHSIGWQSTDFGRTNSNIQSGFSVRLVKDAY